MNDFVKLNNGSWWDPLSDVEFNHDIVWSDRPQEFSYFCRPEHFQSNIRWGMPHAIRYLVRPTMLSHEWSNEHVVTTNLIEKLNGKRAMVIGGGPTALDRGWQREDYDVLLTCNKFYRSPLFQKATPKVDIAVVGPEQELLGFEVLCWAKNNDIMIVLEGGTSPFKSEDEISDFISLFPKQLGFYHLRYFSKLGTAARLVLMAAFCGATEVSFVGLDGDPKLGIHAFEGATKKHIGCATDDGMERRYMREFVLWSEYLQEQFPLVKFNNLGYGHEANQVGWETLNG